MPLKPLHIFKYQKIGSLAKAFGFKFERPVIIIGTGRCGSTLLLHILNSHQQLIGFPDEANELWHPNSYPYHRKKIETKPYVADPEKFTRLSIQNWANSQKSKIKDVFTGFYYLHGKDKKFFTKSAMTGFMLPQIIDIFPDAKIIHLYRNGPSIVESFLKKEWHKYETFFQNQNEYRVCCAKLWNDIILEIQRLKDESNIINENNFLEFSYETLCKDPKQTLDQLCDFIGIESNKFNFDLTSIQCTNYKVGDYSCNEEWKSLLTILKPGMELKGYL